MYIRGQMTLPVDSLMLHAILSELFRYENY